MLPLAQFSFGLLVWTAAAVGTSNVMMLGMRKRTLVSCWDNIHGTRSALLSLCLLFPVVAWQPDIFFLQLTTITWCFFFFRKRWNWGRDFDYELGLQYLSTFMLVWLGAQLQSCHTFWISTIKQQNVGVLIYIWNKLCLFHFCLVYFPQVFQGASSSLRYALAVKQAAAAFGLATAKNPIFVEWVVDPEKVRLGPAPSDPVFSFGLRSGSMGPETS